MKSSPNITRKKEKILGTNFKTTVAQAAIATKERTFSLGSRKPKTFTKVVYFSSKNGWLSPASSGYEVSINEDYSDYKLKIESGQPGRMFTVVFDDKNKPIVAINASSKSISFSEETKPVLTSKRHKPTIGKAMLTLNQMVDGVVLNGNMFVSEDGLTENPPEVPESEQTEETPVVYPKDPAYEAELKRKIEEVFFLRSAKINMSDIFSWKRFLNGTRDQGGVSRYGWK